MVSSSGKTALGHSVRRAIVPLLVDGHPGIARAAEAIGWSVRTLQRRLAGESLTYRGLIDEARFQEACRLFEAPELRLIDITYHLGFADAGSFSRAFERWTGMAPRVYRRRVSRERRILKISV